MSAGSQMQEEDAASLHLQGGRQEAERENRKQKGQTGSRKGKQEGERTDRKQKGQAGSRKN